MDIHELTDLQLDRVDFVVDGAVPGARVLLAKAQQAPGSFRDLEAEKAVSLLVASGRLGSLDRTEHARAHAEMAQLKARIYVAARKSAVVAPVAKSVAVTRPM